ncbi:MULTISPECIES: hypothetical protein [unclassified Streptomyces]|uniref:hypothetical protein n=1 Tax=unclassified Streptomyces TaxID=2593676 RepID=UPI0034297DAD
MTQEEELEMLAGRILINGGRLENLLGSLVRRMTGLKPGDKKFPMQATARVTACEAALGSVPLPWTRVPAEKTLDECKKAFDDRNYYVHGQWLLDCGQDDQDHSVLTVAHTPISGPNKGKKRDEPVDLVKLRTLGEDFLRLRGEVVQLLPKPR